MMKVKTLILLLTSILLSAFTIVILYVLSTDLNHQNNNFNRLFPPHPVVFSKSFDVRYNSYYIAGLTPHFIYLGNSRASLHLLEYNISTNDTSHIKISMDSGQLNGLRSMVVTVDSPNFFIADGVGSSILRGTTGTQSWFAERFMYDSAYFTLSVPISDNSFVIRSVSSLNNEYVLGKESAFSPHLNLVDNVLEKQIDGIFCTDGMLHYVPENNSLLYVYYYRNQFIRLDTNLNVVLKGKTIDTVSTAKIKVATIDSENTITLSAPPLVVNKNSCAFGEWLLVHSNLQARNERKENFQKAAVIDVYSLEDGIYKFSFYLYDYANERVRNFKVINNLLVALHGSHLVIYELRSKYFDPT